MRDHILYIITNYVCVCASDDILGAFSVVEPATEIFFGGTGGVFFFFFFFFFFGFSPFSGGLPRVNTRIFFFPPPLSGGLPMYVFIGDFSTNFRHNFIF